MGVPGVTIELGELSHRHEEPEDDPLLPRSWRIELATVRRVVASMVVLALLGVTLVAAAPARTPLAEVFSVPFAQLRGDFQVDANNLYTVTGGRLAGYRLRDGVRLWESPVPATGARDEHVNLFPVAGLVVVIMIYEQLAVGSTHIYDAATGERLWGGPGGLWAASRASDMIFVEPVDCDASSGCREQVLRGVDGRTGDVRWTVRVPVEIIFASSFELGVPASSERPRLAIIDASGLMTVRDARTGEVTGTHQLPPGPQRWSVNFQGDRLFVQLADAVQAFDATTAAPLWTTEVEVPEGGGWTWSCHRLLCAWGMEGAIAMDPASGAVRWRLPGMMVINELAEGLLMAYPMRNGNVEVYPGAEAQVIDADTGQRRYPLQDWEQMDVPASGSWLWVHRWDAPRSRMWLGLLATDTGEVVTVAAPEGVRDYCVLASSGYLACHGVGRVSVRRLADPAG